MESPRAWRTYACDKSCRFDDTEIDIALLSLWMSFIYLNTVDWVFHIKHYVFQLTNVFLFVNESLNEPRFAFFSLWIRIQPRQGRGRTLRITHSLICDTDDMKGDFKRFEKYFARDGNFLSLSHLQWPYLLYHMKLFFSFYLLGWVCGDHWECSHVAF